jgi:hypothetical protein
LAEGIRASKNSEKRNRLSKREKGSKRQKSKKKKAEERQKKAEQSQHSFGHWAEEAGTLAATLATLKAGHQAGSYLWRNALRPGGRVAIDAMRNFDPFPQNGNPMGGLGGNNGDVGMELQDLRQPLLEQDEAPRGEEADAGAEAEAGAEEGVGEEVGEGIAEGVGEGVAEAGELTAGEILGDIAIGALAVM